MASELIGTVHGTKANKNELVSKKTKKYHRRNSAKRTAQLDKNIKKNVEEIRNLNCFVFLVCACVRVTGARLISREFDLVGLEFLFFSLYEERTCKIRRSKGFR